ncbi:GDNF family receptor alpha-1a, partial [Trematomus bernacchii]|uniref:GDNF family receptor alpha-1a n=1 Tax=Trematomus bernacchii TaxID=40690 RepID=UPI00146EC8EF
MERKTMILPVLCVLLPLLDVWCLAEESLRSGRLDCVRASEHCLKEQVCSTKYRTMRQCVAGGKESNFSMVAGLEAKDECRSAMDAIKQSPLYHCRCKRGMKKEKNCLRIYWGIYQTLQGNDFLEDSPYEPVNSRLSDIFRLAPIIEGGEPWRNSGTSAPGRATDLQDPSRNRRAHPNWAIL